MEENGQVHQVVGGTPAEGALAWAVAALYADGEFECTGVLIDRHHLLTAGHCSPDIDEAVWIDGVSTPVGRPFHHPAVLGGLDAQLFILGAPYGVGLPPVPLALGCGLEAVSDGADATLMGFGSQTTSGTLPDDPVLMAAEVPLVDVDCEDASRGCRTDVEEGSELIAGGDGVDACPGDSGGPLFVDGMLAGTVSRATLYGRSTCGDGGIYVQPRALVGWLMSMDVKIGLPDCIDGPFLAGVPFQELWPEIWYPVDLPEFPGAEIDVVSLSKGLRVRQKKGRWEAWADGDLSAEGARVALHLTSANGVQVVEGIWAVQPSDGGCQVGAGGPLWGALFAALWLRRR